MHGVGRVNIQTDLKINQLNKIKKEEVFPLFLTLYVVEIKNLLSDYVIENVLKEHFIYY